MTTGHSGPPRDRASRLTFLVIAVVASLFLAQEVFKPLALSALLAFVLAPAVSALERRRLPRVAAVVCVVLCALGSLGLLGAVVGNQIVRLANDLPRYQVKIDRKLGGLNPGRGSAFAHASGVFRHVTEALEGAGEGGETAAVRVVPAGTPYWERLGAAAGPSFAFLGAGSVVLILVPFLLLQREDMSDRIVGVFGHRRIGLTTRTMDDAGRRISRYLAAFAAVNSLYGLVVGVGLWAIGVPLPALWGALAAALRFIPYVGPAAAFALPLLLSVVASEGWREPALVVALFGALEVAASTFLEPVVYGRTTGVSAVGLLVAAMFWAWLWGPVGLLLSTPLTVCLAVVGKSVPGLAVFATLLGEGPALSAPLRLYQRLLAVDRGGARAALDGAMRGGGPEAVFDDLLVPVLAKAELDFARKEVDAEDRDLVWRAVDDFLDELEWKAGLSPRITSPSAGGGATGVVLALGVFDAADVLVLRMLNLLLAPWGRDLEIAAGPAAAVELADYAASRAPALVVLSHLPPVGEAATRRVIRRLRERLPEVPVVVGLWGGQRDDDSGRPAGGAEVHVVVGVAEARDRVLTAVVPAAEVALLVERALLAGDDAGAGLVLSRALRDRPMAQVCAGVIEAALASVAEGRAAGRLTLGQEERVAGFFREQLQPSLNAVRTPPPGARRALIACGGGGEDLGTMLVTLLLRSSGWDVLDLGGRVPAGRAPEAAATFRPDAALFFAAAAGDADDLLAAAAAIGKNDGTAPAFAFGGEGFAGPGRAGLAPGPVLPAGLLARVAAVERLVSRHPVPGP